jgi:hypothetical protein
VLRWPKVVCKDRRFKIFILGIVRMHDPSLVVALNGIDGRLKGALRMAATANRTLAPCSSVVLTAKEASWTRSPRIAS